MALRASEKILHDFFEQSPLSLFWIGLDGHIKRVNRAGLELLGCNSHKCLGEPISRFLADPDIYSNPWLTEQTMHALEHQ
jgi:PAS domain S-box-containing protein